MTRTYQASDLAGTGRRAFLDEARGGEARLRDTDGTSLVMVPEDRYRTLVELRDWVLALLMLDNALARPAHNRSPADLGTLAWASAFDDDDLRQFRDELADALARAVSARDITVVEDLVGDWLRTARALSDTTAHEILTREYVDDEFVEVTAPTPTESEHNVAS